MPMPAPAELQAAFAAGMVTGVPAAAGHVVFDRIAPERRLAIHANHYATTLTEALAANFPVVRALVGDGFFALAARGFVVAEPPREPRLFAYGAGFSAWLAAMPELAAVPCVAGVARFEYALNGAWHADDAPTLEPAALAAVPPERLEDTIFAAHPATRLVASRHAVAAVWEAHRAGAASGLARAGEAGPERLLMTRSGDDVAWRRLDAAGHAFFAALLAGRSLGTAATAAVALDDAFDLAEALGAALADGAFRGLRGAAVTAGSGISTGEEP